MSKQMLDIGDHVRILIYPEDSPNGYGRIVGRGVDGCYYVTNLNMPYQGTLINEPFHSEELIKNEPTG